jgi:riboflavin-specific deaminase-like protein
MNDSLTAALAPLSEAEPGRPLVIAQLGQSLDGRIATPTGASKYINGPIALDFLHHLRARVDAVVVGVGTVIADDPQLTVRRVPGRSPARVVIDPNGRMPKTAKCLTPDGAPVYVIQSPGNCDSCPGEAIPVPSGPAGIDPFDIITALRAKEMHRILIEGGAATISRFVAARALDRLYLLVAPVLIGSGKAGLELPPIAELSEALRPSTRSHVLDGGDVLFDCQFEPQREGVR